MGPPPSGAAYASGTWRTRLAALSGHLRLAPQPTAAGAQAPRLDDVLSTDLLEPASWLQLKHAIEEPEDPLLGAGVAIPGIAIRPNVESEDLYPENMTTERDFPVDPSRVGQLAVDPESSFSWRTKVVADLLPEEQVDKLEALAFKQTWGRFETQETQTKVGIGAYMPIRYDLYLRFALSMREVGIPGAGLGEGEIGSRTEFFRTTYMYPEFGKTDEDLAFFMNNPKLIKGARQVFPGRPVIEPYIVYGNLLTRGMFQGVHTDCPAFRGMSRDNAPQWLLSVMHHSGLFDKYRIPVCNGIFYTQDLGKNGDGGAFRHFPNGARGKMSSVPVARNTVVMCDADSQLHGVELIKGDTNVEHERVARLVPPKAGPKSKESWTILDRQGEFLGNCGWNDLRYAVLWKAYCFKDEEERRTWKEKTDELTLPIVLSTLMYDLKTRGKYPKAGIPDQVALAKLLIKEYYKAYPEKEQSIHVEAGRAFGLARE